MLKIYSVSLGCPKNRVDTEHLLGSLGCPVQPVESLAKAQVVLINTCGFIQPAVEESVRTVVEAVQDMASLGKARPLLVVAGCMVGRYGAEELGKELPEVDLWLPNQSLECWPQLLADALNARAAIDPQAGGRARVRSRVGGRGRIGAGAGAGADSGAESGADSGADRGGQKLLQPVPGRLLSTGPSYAWLKISDGCRHACSFCTIPSIRGRHRSTPADLLLPEAQKLLDSGVKELILVAQDVTAWGEDLPPLHSGPQSRPQNLVSLLDRLLPLRGLERLRLLYLYPSGITPELLHFMQGAGPAMLPYFDVPVQHSHDDILSRMGRPFARDPRIVLDRIREALPDAALRTSLIVGFPGEEEAHFAALQSFVEAMRFTHMGVFAYRAEEGTPAALMPRQVEESVKQWRRDSLMEQQAEISAAYLAHYTGQSLPILVDAVHPEWPGLHTGRAWFQAPEIDGQTYISGPGVAPGALVEADIVETGDYDLTALT